MRKNKWAKYLENLGDKKDIEDSWLENDLDVEMVDLDALDTQRSLSEEPQRSIHSSWSIQVLRWQRSFNRRRWRTVFVVISLLLVCFLLLQNTQGMVFLTKKVRTDIASRSVQVPLTLKEHLPTPIPINPTLFLSMKQLGFSCMLDQAWSPDNTMIAIQGYAIGCENSSSQSVSFISIINAHSGSRIDSFMPDTPIKKSFALQYPTTHGILSIFYDKPSWSPDKRHFALTFSLTVQTVNNGTSYTGVLVYDLQLKSFRVLIKQDAVDYSNQGVVSSYVEWDLVHGNVVKSPLYTSDAPFFFSLPAAERYTWGKNGDLVPQIHETIPTANVGNTSGDQSFSIWQSGDLSFLTHDDLGFAYMPGIFVWNVHFIAWSPDGRYLIQNAYTAARLAPSGYPVPSQKVLAVFHLENVPVLPVRDQGLLAVTKALEDMQTQSIAAGLAAVVWSPNGKLMWRSSFQTSLMTLYTTRYGFPIAFLRDPSLSNSDAQRVHEGYDVQTSLCWSPDSHHILLQDSNTNALIIYTLPNSLQ